MPVFLAPKPSSIDIACDVYGTMADLLRNIIRRYALAEQMGAKGVPESVELDISKLSLFQDAPINPPDIVLLDHPAELIKYKLRHFARSCF